MRNPLSKNTTLILQNTDRVYVVDDVIGVGANSIVYDAHWEDEFDLCHLVRIKELYPVKAAITRIADNTLIWNNVEEQKYALDNFEKEYVKHQHLASFQDTMNSTVQFQETLLRGNNTDYMVMSVDNGKPYNAVTDYDLHDMFMTLLAIAKVVRVYHEKGLLLLDIKPENFLVLPETRGLVKLYDFDSVISDRKVLEQDTIISYSYDYAAPELRMGKRKSICKATDYYSIGSIAFERIMGRFPNADDCLRFSDWDLSDNAFFKNNSPKCQRLIKSFFRKTLSSTIRARYATDQQLIDDLQDIVKETTPGRCFLYPSKRATLSSFIGREQELGKIHEAFASGKHIVFLQGVGGIGKTELSKVYAQRFSYEYDTVCFGVFKDTTEALLQDVSFLSFSNVSASEQTIKDILNRLSVTDEHTLLIIDDYRYVEEDSKFESLLSLPCHILITTRDYTRDLFTNKQIIEHISLNSLQPQEQWQLFTAGYHRGLSEDEKQNIDSLFSLVDGHTMFIDLFAKNLQATGLSVTEAIAEFNAGGFNQISEVKVRHSKDGLKTDTIEGFFTKLFSLSNLSEDAKRALSCLTLLGDIHIDKHFLCHLSGCSLDTVNLELIQRGWLNYSQELDDVSSHTIIVKCVSSILTISLNQLPELKQYVCTFLENEQLVYGNEQENKRIHDKLLLVQSILTSDLLNEKVTLILMRKYIELSRKWFEQIDAPFGDLVFNTKFIISLIHRRYGKYIDKDLIYYTQILIFFNSLYEFLSLTIYGMNSDAQTHSEKLAYAVEELEETISLFIHIKKGYKNNSHRKQLNNLLLLFLEPAVKSFYLYGFIEIRFDLEKSNTFVEGLAHAINELDYNGDPYEKVMCDLPLTPEEDVITMYDALNDVCESAQEDKNIDYPHNGTKVYSEYLQRIQQADNEKLLTIMMEFSNNSSLNKEEHQFLLKASQERLVQLREERFAEQYRLEEERRQAEIAKYEASTYAKYKKLIYAAPTPDALKNAIQKIFSDESLANEERGNLMDDYCRTIGLSRIYVPLCFISENIEKTYNEASRILTRSFAEHDLSLKTLLYQGFVQLYDRIESTGEMLCLLSYDFYQENKEENDNMEDFVYTSDHVDHPLNHVWLHSWTSCLFAILIEITLDYIILDNQDEEEKHSNKLFEMLAHYNNFENKGKNESEIYWESCIEDILYKYEEFMTILYFMKRDSKCLFYIKQFEKIVGSSCDEGIQLRVFNLAIKAAERMNEIEMKKEYLNKKKDLQKTGFHYNESDPNFLL